MKANQGTATGLSSEGQGETDMTTLVKPGEIQTSIERVRPGSRPTVPASAVKIEEYNRASGTNGGAAQPHHVLARVQAGGPSPRRIGVWAALLARIFGPAATQRERRRKEAYQERLKGYGSLTHVTYPRF